MSLWSSVVNALDLEGDALMDANENLNMNSDDASAPVDLEHLLVELRVEKSNAQRLSQALDEEQNKRRTEVQQLKNLLFDKEQELEDLQSELDSAKVEIEQTKIQASKSDDNVVRANNDRPLVKTKSRSLVAQAAEETGVASLDSSPSMSSEAVVVVDDEENAQLRQRVRELEKRVSQCNVDNSLSKKSVCEALNDSTLSKLPASQILARVKASASNDSAAQLSTLQQQLTEQKTRADQATKRALQQETKNTALKALFEKQSAALRQQLDDAKQQAVAAKNELTTTQQQLQATKQQMKQLQQERIENNAAVTTSTNDIDQQQLNETKKHLESCQKQLTNVQTEYQRLQKQQKQNEVQRTELELRLKESEEARALLATRADEATLALSQASQRAEDAERRLIAARSSKGEETQRALADADAARSEARANADECVRLRAELAEMKTSLETSTRREKDLEAEAMTLRQASSKNIKEIERLRTHLLEQEENDTDAEVQVAQLTQQLEDLKLQNKQFERSANAVIELESLIEEKNSEIEVLNDAVNNLQNAMEEIQLSKENDIRVELSQMQSELSLAQQQLRDMRSLEERLEMTKNELASVSLQLSSKQNEIDAMKHQHTAAIDDAATLRFTVEKLVGQVDLLSQNELKMIDRQQMKSLILSLYGGSQEKNDALNMIANMFEFNEQEKKKVGLVAAGWFESIIGSSDASNGDADRAIGSEFVNYLENSLLETEVRDIIEQDNKEKAEARKQKKVDEL